MRLACRRGAIKGANGSARARRHWRAPASNVEGVETVYDLADAGDKPIDRRRGGPPEGRGGAPNELPSEERLSIMSIWRARQSSTIRARKGLTKRGPCHAAHWLAPLPLARVWLHTPRPSMPPGEVIARGEKAKRGKTDFCWLVLAQSHQGPAMVRWLHRDNVQ